MLAIITALKTFVILMALIGAFGIPIYLGVQVGRRWVTPKFNESRRGRAKVACSLAIVLLFAACLMFGALKDGPPPTWSVLYAGMALFCSTFAAFPKDKPRD